uniref:Uncharacterized protein n=1 Tax=Amphimedon queenslandica TaxID=400682 RepID=A0A1X7VSL7_AMPQE
LTSLQTLWSWKGYKEGRPSSFSTISPVTRLRSLNLPLMMTFELQDLIFFIKAIKTPDPFLNILDYVSSNNTTRFGAGLKLPTLCFLHKPGLSLLLQPPPSFVDFTTCHPRLCLQMQ